MPKKTKGATAQRYNVTAVLNYLTGALGKPYRWAAAGPNAYDCSGLSMRAFAAGGYSMPHQSMAQYLQTRRYQIPPTDSPPAGCLVFFGTAGVIHHVGVSIGGGQGIFAPHTGANVEKESIAAVRSSFTTYHVTNPIGVSDSEGLTKAEQTYASRAGQGKVPALLGLFLAALRWQESGSPHGNYSEPNGQGAYQIIPSSWQAATRTYGVGQQYATASAAPPAVQDDIAAARVTSIYYGAGEKSWRITARVWNGGTPNTVPNPALGAGATTNTYATEVLAKMAKINPAQLSAAAAGTSTADTGTGGCVHELSINLHITSAHICMDKPLAIVSVMGGTTLVFAGVAVILVSTLGKNRAVAAAVNAVPAGRALTVAKGLTPKAREARGQQREADEAKRTAPIRTAQREAAAETRREAQHSQRLSAARARQRRAATSARLREERADESHGSRMNAASSARIRARQRTRSVPGPGHEPYGRERRDAIKAPALPDKPPF